MNIESQRTKFEAWATGGNMSIARSIVEHPQWRYEYVSNTTESAWRAWLEAVRQNTQELTQRIGELCQQVNERDVLIGRIEENTRAGVRTYAQAEFIIQVINDECTRLRKRKPIIDRCATCGLALNDDGTCDDCFLAGMQLGLIDAMERGDELRDRAKDEQ